MPAVRLFDPAAERLLDPSAEPERVATGFRFTEGPLWDPVEQCLLFSDIPADRIYRWRPGLPAEVFREPSGKSNGLAWGPGRALLACEHVGRRVSRTLPGGVPTTLVGSFGGRPLNSPNDLVVHSSGAVYFSDPPYGILSADMGRLAPQEQPVNGLYLLRPGESEPVLLAGDFERPNGLAFSPDESLLYMNDTPRYQTRRFTVRPDGLLEGGEVWAVYPADAGEGRPDGMKVDAQGNVYTTGPGGLWVLDPAGRHLAHVDFPEKTANCAWGGDGCDLYVTASTSVYLLRTRVPGCRLRFRGEP